MSPLSPKIFHDNERFKIMEQTNYRIRILRLESCDFDIQLVKWQLLCDLYLFYSIDRGFYPINTWINFTKIILVITHPGRSSRRRSIFRKVSYYNI